MRSWWGGKSSKSLTLPDAQPSKHPFDLSTDPKPGFLGNLSIGQYEVLQQFKQRYADKVKLCVDETKTIAFSKEEEFVLFQVNRAENQPSVSYEFTEIDCFLLRFLRARSFSLEKAGLMLDEYLKWRISFNVKEICEVVKFPWIEKFRAVYPHGYHGVDKIGRPIYIERIGKADISAALKLTSLDYLLAYWVQQYEYVRRVILPACSIAAGRRIEQGISIIDLTGLGFSHCGSQSRNVVRQIAKLSQDYFPEMLGAMVLVNAPAVFSPVWSFARSLIDEKTVAKISLLTNRSTHWKQYLQELAEPDQLPEFLGGTSPDSAWQSNRGPWTDPKIVKQLELHSPTIPRNLLHFDVCAGDVESLKVLKGLSIPSPLPDNEDSKELDDLAKQAEVEVDVSYELRHLSESGVNVVE